MAVYEFGRQLAKAKSKLSHEVLPAQRERPLRYFDSLDQFTRLITRSRGLEYQGYLDESYALLMIGLESLLGEKASIVAAVSRRVGALIALAGGKPFEDTLRDISSRYDARSKFVHEGQPIAVVALEQLKEACSIVFFSILRSQTQWIDRGDGQAHAWRDTCIKQLDYIVASLKVGVPIHEPSAALCGATPLEPAGSQGSERSNLADAS
jgi:hypothetical protein